MVRLNGGIALRRNTPDDAENEGGSFFQKATFFGGMIGAVMAALKMKEKWDDYRAVPSEPGANSLAPPAYRDDGDDESVIGLSSPLDTSVNVPTRAKRRRNCCMCCGVNCSLFCKAFGIVVLLLIVWNVIKLAKWALTPSPTGLEGMPEFSKSLGCLDAKNYYTGNQDIYYSIPVGDKVDHDILINGGAVGTLTIAPSTSSKETYVKHQLTIRSSDASLLKDVLIQTPGGSSKPPSTKSTSYFSLSTSSGASQTDACLRFDVTVFIPPTLRTLSIKAHSVTQIKFSDDFSSSPRELGDLHISLSSVAAATMLLPSGDLAADNVVVEMRGGYLVGTLPIANSSHIDTSRGDAITKLTVSPTAYDIPQQHEGQEDKLAVAYLSTLTGSGRSDFVYENVRARPIHSEHTSSGMGDMYLTYKKAGYNGFVDLNARSYTAMGLQTSGRPGMPGASGERWAGNKEGGDVLKISSMGWVGLYF